jgi:Raf kinase inhibitor-like YbhB/YbcL family protein
MNKTIHTAAVLAGVATLALGTAGVADADSRPAPNGGYGTQLIRSGIPASATRFTVRSPDVRDGGSFPAANLADTFGCTGGNHQPRLSWSGAPAGTRSYAVTLYDPDAPTGSGFWHWLERDIPVRTTTLNATPPGGAVSGLNDAGQTGYLGPCPPAGDIVHRYQITVYALDVASLGLPAGAPPAVAGFTMSSHIIGYARMTVTARR